MKHPIGNRTAFPRTGTSLAIGAALMASLLGWGCSSDGDSDLARKAAGTEGGACLSKGGCDVGLVCKDGKCGKGGGSGGSGGSAGSSGGTGGAVGSGGASGGSGGATGGSSGASGSGGSSGSAGSGGTGSGGDGGSAGAACNGTHPLLDAGARFCAPDECRCQSSDLCFPQAQAARCCNGPMRCFDADGGVACEGTHPLVDASNRFCAPGACYCGANDACYPAATAAICCSETPSCN